MIFAGFSWFTCRGDSQRQQTDSSVGILNAVERTLKCLNGQSIKYFSYCKQSEVLGSSHGLQKTENTIASLKAFLSLPSLHIVLSASRFHPPPPSPPLCTPTTQVILTAQEFKIRSFIIWLQ